MSNKQSSDNTTETVAFSYNASSGNVRVLYYPLTAEVRIINPKAQKQYGSWGPESLSVLLSPQDAFEISIYLIGLQPHIREALARKEKDMPVQELPEDEQEDEPEDLPHDKPYGKY